MPANSAPPSIDHSTRVKQSANVTTHDKKITINLNGREKTSSASIFYKWTIQIGRVVIVLTELIALGALGYRFFIDRQIADINDQISREVTFIKNQGAQETKFRVLQDKLNAIKLVSQDTNGKVDIMNKILDAERQGVFSIDSMTVNRNTVSINGSSSSIFALNNFTEELKQNPNVLNINIEDISSTENGLLFKLSVDLVTVSDELEGPITQ